MSDMTLDLDLDLDLDAGVDLPDDVDVVDSPVISETGLDLSQPPDPVRTVDVAPVTFGETVEFPDGTVVENPHTDHLGYKYQSTQDWVHGDNKHVPD